VAGAAVSGLLVPVAARVYSVDALQAGMQQAPRAWIGRAVLVRGRITGYGGWDCSGAALISCRHIWLQLQPSDAGSSAIPAALAASLPPGLRPLPPFGLTPSATLSRLPIIGPALAGWDGSRTLRLRLTSVAGPCMRSGSCIGGVLTP